MKITAFLILLLTAGSLSAQDSTELNAATVSDVVRAVSVEVAESTGGEPTTVASEERSGDTLPQIMAPAPKQTSSEMPELFSARYLFQVVGSLFVVFICLFAVIYMLRRFNRMGPSSGTALRIIGSANVGQRERVVLLEAGSEQVLLGVAPGSVRALHVLAEPLVLEEGVAPATDFAAILRAANPLGGKS